MAGFVTLRSTKYCKYQWFFGGLWIVLGVVVGCVGRVGVVVLLNDFIEQSMRR